MLRPARLLFAAFALAALSPAVARADEPSAPARKGRHHHHHRRAKNDEPAARASRGGATATPLARAATPVVKLKKAPAEKAESVGSPNDGHLKGGAHIDLAKPYFRVVPVYESGDVRWALPIMINMIDRSARNVHKRFPGSTLDVGDLSQKGGGDLLRHHSHETGRDADLGFYALDAKGKQIHGRTFVKFNPDLSSPNHPGARFDLARNWAFVQELISDPVARVSHIFIAEWLKRELLGYARTHAPRAVYDRAALVMMQPHNSLPHDDHFHVRISCPHEAHSQCIELAKNAPRGHARVAKKTHAGGQPLKTPGHGHGHGHHPQKPPPASAATPMDPFPIPAVPDPGVEEIDPDGAHDDAEPSAPNG
ncbi:Murein endopeptidase [Minicystis rosea]|nr:Murein endopeptidase [Minicystis rosea]